MSQAQNGDTVKVHYTGKLDDGTVFDSSLDQQPLEFTLGQQQLIPGFEAAVLGMGPGDTKTVQVPADEAYGPHRAELVFQVGRESMPPSLQPEVGQNLEMQHQDGTTLPLTVTEVSESSVTLDANHPLAGKELTFELELVEVSGG